MDIFDYSGIRVYLNNFSLYHHLEKVTSEEKRRQEKKDKKDKKDKRDKKDKNEPNSLM